VVLRLWQTTGEPGAQPGLVALTSKNLWAFEFKSHLGLQADADGLGLRTAIQEISRLGEDSNIAVMKLVIGSRSTRWSDRVRS
jgi:hypothetical protein